jgi:hypothetical protein
MARMHDYYNVYILQYILRYYYGQQKFLCCYIFYKQSKANLILNIKQYGHLY